VARLHLIEFEDLPWFPAPWRDLITDVLAFFDSTFHPFRPIIPRMKMVLEKLNCNDIVDLCSGGSGPILGVIKQLEKGERYPVRVVLTDKYPNLPAFRDAKAKSAGQVVYEENSVDALDVPVHLKGFRTLFASFHHFRPGDARKILQDAVAKGVGIGVFEYTELNLIWFLAILFIPLALWLYAPFLRPFRWSRLVWVYLFPLPAWFAVWDGFVSLFRSYSPQALEDLTRSLGEGKYVWDIGRVRSFGACYVTYLIGYPV
jgi:hypothetical protein